ncbi:DUF6973 domain-containing protein [Polaribacter uvawellassae]|uniref:DUF6973 domain-containing protein n=1 Tax=Polaribacter uvawellassae TaxID=3133495 RepID=UPI00321A9DDD
MPSPEALVEAAKVVLNQFPYEEIEGYATTNNPNPYSTNHEMIKNDFSDLSDSQLETNTTIIDDYYSDNLDYMVLNEIAINPQLYNHLGTNKYKQGVTIGDVWNEIVVTTCTLSFTYDYGLVRPAISYFLATPIAYFSAESKYPNLGGSNDRRDAYRHMLWSSLLAQYYFTISSKSKGFNFSKLVTDLREGSICGTGNPIDGKAMDLHNNFIGRKIWSDGTDYLKVFGITIGLIKSSTSQYKIRIYNIVERESCYIVKTNKDNSNFDYSKEEVYSIIQQENINTPVYFIDPIAPVSYVGSIELEYYECDDNEGDFIPKRRRKTTNAFGIVPDETGDCFREIMVYTPVYPCYKTEDPNYNPY